MRNILGGTYSSDDALSSYSSVREADLFVKGKQKHSIGDIILIAGKKHIVIEKDGKIAYKYYGSGQGAKAQLHFQEAKKKTPEEKFEDKMFQDIEQALKDNGASIDEYGYTFMKDLGGSTGAKLVIKDGVRYVKKTAASPEHLANEVRSLKYYEQMGVKVPKVKEYVKGKCVYVEFIEGKTLGQIYATEGANKWDAACKELSKNFAIDALMGNWDVVGLNYDNVIVNNEGTPVRVDVGGSLEYRAQGQKKTDSEWGDDAEVDIKNMLNKQINLQTASVFLSSAFNDSGEAAEAAVKAKLFELNPLPDFLQVTGSKQAEKLRKRFDNLKKSVIGASKQSKEKKEEGTAEINPDTTYTKAQYIDFFSKSRNGILNLIDGDSKSEKIVNETFDKLNRTMNITDGDVEWLEKNFQILINELPQIGSGQKFIGIDGDYKMHSSTVQQYAKDNYLTPLEVGAIIYHTGSDYQKTNKLLVDIIDNKDGGNVTFNDIESLQKTNIHTNEEMLARFGGDKYMRAYFLITKLMMRGINKALAAGGKNVTDKTTVCYRKFGGPGQVDELSKVFRKGQVVAQARASSKTYSDEGSYGKSSCKMMYLSKGLVVEPVSENSGEQEILFPPFHPMRVLFSEVNKDGKLQLVSNNVSNTFFN